MSSKSITIVLGMPIVILISYFGYQDAVRTWHNLHQQETQVEYLNTKQQELDQKLDYTTEVEQSKKQEVEQLENQRLQLEEEKKKLELELQASLGRALV